MFCIHNTVYKICHVHFIIFNSLMQMIPVCYWSFFLYNYLTAFSPFWQMIHFYLLRKFIKRPSAMYCTRFYGQCQKRPLIGKYYVLSGVAQHQRCHSAFQLNTFMVVKIVELQLLSDFLFLMHSKTNGV